MSRAITIIFSLFYFLVPICEASSIEQGIKFESKETQAILIHKLDQHAINYHIDSGGVLWTKKSDKKQVNKIKTEVFNAFHSDNEVIFGNNKYLLIFQKKLDKAGIAYRIIFKYETQTIAWLDKDANKVKQLLKEMDEIGAAPKKRASSPGSKYQ